MIEKEQDKKNAKLNQNPRDEEIRQIRLNQDDEQRISSTEIRAKKRENSITSGIEKFLKAFKTKEIKPLHLDRHTNQQLETLGQYGRIHELQTYNNFALRRFTNLFQRDTKIRLQEVEVDNIDHHGLQELNA